MSMWMVCEAACLAFSQAREHRDKELEEIDQRFAAKTGSKHTFTKECSSEIGIEVAPGDVYALWLAFLEAAES